MTSARRYFEALKSNWNGLAKEDPLWAVLSHPDKRGTWNETEFFATGRAEIEEALGLVQRLGIRVQLGAALDFGCGPGRLSQALAAHFDTVSGIDISEQMIELARQYDRDKRCRFQVWDRGDLRCFTDESFDFVYTNLVLQHVRPQRSAQYLREFSRVLRPNGIVVFQLPSEIRPTLKGRVMRLLNTPMLLPIWNRYRRVRHGMSSHMEMHGIPEPEVRRIVTEAGLVVSHVRESPIPIDHWISRQYVCQKPDPAARE
jgi:ubiquinone/menaquinone biosynthesis C-methylase UbiE